MKPRTRLSLAAVVAFVGIAVWIGLNHLDTTANDTIDKTAPTSSKRTEPVCPKSPEAASAIKAGTKLKPIASDNAPSVPAASESSKYEDSEIGSAYADFINAKLETSLRDIPLTSDQCKELQDVYSAVVHARLQYELSILTATKTSERETEIEIPSYPAFGQKLKNLTLSSFTNILGSELASKVIDRLGRGMDLRNRFWGESPQKIHITYVPETKEYRIFHDINSDKSTTGEGLHIETSRQQELLNDYTKFAPYFPQPE